MGKSVKKVMASTERVMAFASLVTEQSGNRSLALNMSVVELLYYISGTDNVTAASLYQRDTPKQTVRSQLKTLVENQLIERLPKVNFGGNTNSNIFRCTEEGRNLLELWPHPLNIPKMYELIKTVPLIPRAPAMNLMHIATLSVIGRAKSSTISAIDLAAEFDNEPLISVQRRTQYLIRQGWVVGDVRAINGKPGRSSILMLSEKGLKLCSLV